MKILHSGHKIMLVFMVGMCVFGSTYYSFSQSDLSQSVYGKITDQITHDPLVGVNIIARFNDKLVGTTTDTNGFYILEDVPVGIVSIEISSIGFETYLSENVRIVSGKALQLNVQLTEKSIELGQVEVKAYSRKDKPLNELAVVSARSFTVDETNRYAGSYGDPARMAINYAGVLPARDNRNDIIIRGNSSSGLQWRLDGVEILNPNHFGATATTGGPITIINNNLLANSDFFTGAFPAEYGNALAGVFDLKMRYGNNMNHEHWMQLGWNGLEVGSEGPVNKKNNSSYIISYRYSFIDIIKKLGANIEESSEYQDLSFKFNFPQTRAGAFSVFGIGGKSYIEITDSDKSQNDWTFSNHGEDIFNDYKMGVVGISNRLYARNTSFETHLAVMGNEVMNTIDTFYLSPVNKQLWAFENSIMTKIVLNEKVKYKISANSYFSTGFNFDHYIIAFADSQYYSNRYRINADVKGESFDLFRVFALLSFNDIDKVSFNTGLHVSHVFLNSETVIEPRFGIEYQINRNHKVSYGSGLHSRIHPLVFYYIRSDLENEDFVLTNSDLKMTKSIHNIFGYDWRINNSFRFKTEAYYQYLYDVPTSANNPWYSTINYGTEYFVERHDSLVNEATGKNIGLDMTLEKFFDNNYYFLFTLSVFDSKYKSLDNIWRNTAYNGRYAVNLLGGYEWYFPKKHAGINVGINLTYAGGRPYVPFDQEATSASRSIRYNDSEAFEVYREPYRRISLRIGIKRDTKKFSTETAIDFQYRSNYTNVYLERIDVLTGEIVKTHKMGFYPMATFRVNF